MLLTAAIWLLFVLVALRLPFRHGRLGLIVFLMTLTFNELPLVLLGAFLVSMGLAGRPSGSTNVALVVALTLAAIAGLVWLQLRANTARGALEGGLDRGLGPGWRSAPSPGGRSGRLPPTPWARGVLLPFQRRTRGVERASDLSYGPDPAHRVDLYRRTVPGGPRPVLIHLHGGGFVSGGKSRESRAMLHQLAAHGWICLSANYRLRRGGHHPHPLIDAKRLIAWVRDKHADLGADPSQVFLAGCSAGGHLAMTAALTASDAGLQRGFETAETGVAGAVILYGYLGPRTSARSSSPVQLAHVDAPPMLLLHGSDDTMVPARDAREVARAIREASSSPVVFIELPRTQHNFDRFASVRSRLAASAVEAFLDWARLRAAETRADPAGMQPPGC